MSKHVTKFVVQIVTSTPPTTTEIESVQDGIVIEAETLALLDGMSVEAVTICREQ